MTDMKYSNRELKLTAALYIQKPGVLEYVKKHATLPKEINTGGMDIGMRILIRNRGRDIELREDEKLIYDAILSSGRLPSGVVILIEDHPEHLN